MPASGLSGSGNASRETEGGNLPVKPKQKPSEAMSTCWTCQRIGHWARNCPEIKIYKGPFAWVQIDGLIGTVSEAGVRVCFKDFKILEVSAKTPCSVARHLYALRQALYGTPGFSKAIRGPRQEDRT